MREQRELTVEERIVSAPQMRRLRHEGIVPANIYGQSQPSLALQVDGIVLQRLLARGGSNVIQLKVGDKPAVQALIKKVQRDPVSGKTIHVDFLRVAASEKMKARVQLHFFNEARTGGGGQGIVSRPLNEVMVECLPAALPANIQVDLSTLREIGSAIRVGDLVVGPGVTVTTDHNELVAALHQQVRGEKAEGVEGKVEAVAAAPAPLGT
ncbi:MAG: 50S ribosomal protein L25 [Chloroflexi bacterium]|nr:50S ribosomal protein L25 [Chloroflexota bacterium]MCL5109418.1 50S ribosomal protein L25 [Chloroflexota bacterium]